VARWGLVVVDMRIIAHVPDGEVQRCAPWCDSGARDLLRFRHTGASGRQEEDVGRPRPRHATDPVPVCALAVADDAHPGVRDRVVDGLRRRPAFREREPSRRRRSARGIAAPRDDDCENRETVCRKPVH